MMDSFMLWAFICVACGNVLIGIECFRCSQYMGVVVAAFMFTICISLSSLVW